MGERADRVVAERGGDEREPGGDAQQPAQVRVLRCGALEGVAIHRFRPFRLVGAANLIRSAAPSTSLPTQTGSVRGPRAALDAQLPLPQMADYDADRLTLRLDGLPPARHRPPTSSTCPSAPSSRAGPGITHVLDRGLSPLALESLLETAGEHIDLIKLGWGTAYVSARRGGQGRDLPRRRHRGSAPAARCWRSPSTRAGSTATSSGCASSASTTSRSPTARCRWPRGRKRELIHRLAGEFTVIAEVGSKGAQDAVRRRVVRRDARRPRRGRGAGDRRGPRERHRRPVRRDRRGARRARRRRSCTRSAPRR